VKYSYLPANRTLNVRPQITIGTQVKAMAVEMQPKTTYMLYTPMPFIHGVTAKTRAVAMTLRIKTTPVRAGPIIFARGLVEGSTVGSRTTYMLVRILKICEGHVSTASYGKTNET